jgi:heptosyltransferase-1
MTRACWPAADRAPRVLITRLSAIGDCVQTLPVAVSLRRMYPQAYIAWAVERAAAPLIAACRAVDEVVVVPKRMLASPRAVWQMRRTLVPVRAEIALDPQGLTKSSTIGWLSGAARRIGFSRPQAREISPWLNTTRIMPQSSHMVERYLELLRPLEAEADQNREAKPLEPQPIEFGLDIPASVRRDVQAMIDSRQLKAGFAVINPGAGWDSKRWEIDRLATVARELAREFGLPSLVVWGNDQEHGAAEEVVRGAGRGASLAPATSLLELAAVLDRAKLVVSADSGPLHLAAAVGTRCVGLFGSTRRELCGPYGTGHIAIQADYDGSPSRKRRGADNWAMQSITVPMVMAACAEILAPAAEGSAGNVVCHAA